MPLNTTPSTLSAKDIERFSSKVDRSNPDGCWLWTAGRDKDGYGKFKARRRHLRAHRVALFIATGEWPEETMHECDNPPCCRVGQGHIRAGTRVENRADMKAKSRSALGDKNGKRTHPESIAYGDAHWSHRLPERVARGEENGYAKLTQESVLAIRAAHAAGDTLRRIAKHYGVGPSTVHRVVNRLSWSHV